MERRSAIAFIALKTDSSIVKPSWAAKRAARSMRSGSSENESSGVLGVRSVVFSKSVTPLCGSMNSGVGVVSSIAIAFTVKSRRSKSPSIVSPKFTSGLRESLS